MMARPTRKALGIAGGALVLFFVGSNIQAGWMYVLGASLVGTVLAGLVLPAVVLRGIEVARTVPPMSRVGDPVAVRLEVRNRRRSGSGPLSGVDRFLASATSGKTLAVEGLSGGSTASLEYVAVPRRRGVHGSSDVVLRSGFPFGTGTAERRSDVPSRMVVHPRWVSLSGVPLLEAASIPSEALHDRRRRGAGLDFFGVREYRPGDSLRHVHWKSTARGGRPVVREYEELPASRIGIFIETVEVVGEEPETTLEDSVAAAASLVVYGLEVGHPVQLFSAGASGADHLFEPGRAEALDWLAEVEPRGDRGLSRVVSGALGEVAARSTNFVIFPTTVRALTEARSAAAALQGAGTRVIAVIVSAASYDPRGRGVLTGSKEEELATELASSRTIVYRIEKGKDLAECLREPWIS
jgi:uncharacterized protein (DUF58 family)